MRASTVFEKELNDLKVAATAGSRQNSFVVVPGCFIYVCS